MTPRRPLPMDRDLYIGILVMLCAFVGAVAFLLAGCFVVALLIGWVAT